MAVHKHTRRTFLRAIPGFTALAASTATGAGVAMATFPALASAPAVATQKQIVARMNDISAELSMLLGDLDGGRWELRVLPPHLGAPNYLVQPNKVPPRARLEQGMTIVAGALHELHPGSWRKCYDEEGRFVLITNDAVPRS